jgi:predicted dehydrogenase
VREIVASGRLGRLLSTSLIAYDELSLGTIDEGDAYLLDVANGANPLTLHSAHYLDALCYVLGELVTVSATTAISRPRIVVRQMGETITSTSPDQIAACGLLADGTIASFHMRAGSGDPSFRWEIQGENASPRVTSTGYLMWRPPTLDLWNAPAKQWEPVPPPAPLPGGEVPGPEGPAQFVARPMRLSPATSLRFPHNRYRSPTRSRAARRWRRSAPPRTTARQLHRPAARSTLDRRSFHETVLLSLLVLFVAAYRAARTWSAV